MAQTEGLYAIKDGSRGWFSLTTWKSGQPQRYGWQEEGKEGKTLPKEIIEFVTRRREAVKEPVKDEPIVQIVKEIKNMIEDETPNLEGQSW